MSSRRWQATPSCPLARQQLRWRLAQSAEKAPNSPVSRETAWELQGAKRRVLPRPGAATLIPDAYPGLQNFHQGRCLSAGGDSDRDSM